MSGDRPVSTGAGQLDAQRQHKQEPAHTSRYGGVTRSQCSHLRLERVWHRRKVASHVELDQRVRPEQYRPRVALVALTVDVGDHRPGVAADP